ncbi:MAG TPA: nitrilase-related carbon-nitrogen hydrolase, partial [Bacteroidales bacterium]|nr:nitrilase-related carbon-nitrogen hydrolase [Bacteroidales bacterium]
MQNNSQKLNLALFQTELTWENPGENIERLSRETDTLTRADLIVCPEMFTTGFSMESERLAEPHKGESYQAIARLAAQYDTAIVFSMITRAEGKYYNRLYFIFPDGTSAHYDKKHLFTMGEEDQHYAPGSKRLYVDYKGWRIMPLVCYDLRFPVWSRNVSNYDLLIYVADWPKVRAEVWKSLLKARALENQAYVAGVNCIGTDGRNLD